MWVWPGWRAGRRKSRREAANKVEGGRTGGHPDVMECDGRVEGELREDLDNIVDLPTTHWARVLKLLGAALTHAKMSTWVDKHTLLLVQAHNTCIFLISRGLILGGVQRRLRTLIGRLLLEYGLTR